MFEHVFLSPPPPSTLQRKLPEPEDLPRGGGD